MYLYRNDVPVGSRQYGTRAVPSAIGFEAGLQSGISSEVAAHRRRASLHAIDAARERGRGHSDPTHVHSDLVPRGYAQAAALAIPEVRRRREERDTHRLRMAEIA